MASSDIEWSTIFDDFISYCTRFDPTFRETIVAATPADLEEIETVSKLKVPPEYTQLLLRMGRTAPGSLGRFFSDMEFGVEAVKRFYLDPPIPVPADAIYLWTLDVDIEMFLGLAAKNEEPRPVVNFSWSADPSTHKFTNDSFTVNIIASSLCRFLYKEAFLTIRDPVLPFHAELSELLAVEKPNADHRAQKQAEFRNLAEKLGFTPVPYMNHELTFYDREDATLMLYSHEYVADAIYAGADDERELARLCDIVSDNLDFYVLV